MSPAPVPALTSAPPPLERLAQSPHLSEQEKVAEASRQFEALLVRQILRQTQQPVIVSSLTEESAAAGIYRDLFCEQLAEAIARSGTLGLARSLQQQLLPRSASASPTVFATAQPGTDTALPPASPAGRPASTRPAEPPSPARGGVPFERP
ncbi:MAG: rod-binding protein [Limisphaera sp.]